jgi:hypothetical protein
VWRISHGLSGPLQRHDAAIRPHERGKTVVATPRAYVEAELSSTQSDPSVHHSDLYHDVVSPEESSDDLWVLG